MAKLHRVALRAELTVRGFFENFLARRAGWSAGRFRHEPFDEGSARIFSEGHLAFDERSARILFAGSPRHSGKSAKSASRVLAGTTGNMPIALWVAEWAQFLFQGGEDDLNSEDAEVHSGGTDVVSISSTLLVYAVYGVVELLPDRGSAQLTSRSLCSPLTPEG